MIGVLDYGLGNVNAFINVFDRLGVSSRRVKACTDLH